MGVLPPFLQDGKLHNICLVLEGYEEYYYFNRILDFPCFKGTYHVELRNAKAASNIPSIFQAAYAKNFYEIILLYVIRTESRSSIKASFQNWMGFWGQVKLKKLLYLQVHVPCRSSCPILVMSN